MSLRESVAPAQRRDQLELGRRLGGEVFEVIDVFGDLVGDQEVFQAARSLWRLGIGPVPFPGFLYFFYSLGAGLEKIWYRKKSRNRSRKKLVPKKVSEPVSKKFGTEKSPGPGLEKFGTEKKYRNQS